MDVLIAPPLRSTAPRRALLALSLFAAGVHPALADGERAATPGPAQPGAGGAASVVTVQGSAAAYDARRYDTAAQIVVGREELAKFGDAAVSDVLKRQPGVTVDANGAISMRGLGNGYTQILLNGQKVAPGFSIDSLSPDLIERVEIRRSAIAEQRAEAIAGTINIVLKKTPRRSQQVAKAMLANARGRWAPGASWEWSERGDALSYSVVGAAGTRDLLLSFRDDTTGTDAAGAPVLARHGRLRLDGRIDTVSLTPNASLKLAGGDTLALQTFLSATRFHKDAAGRLDTSLGEPAEFASNTQLTEDRGGQARADLGWTHKIAPSATLESNLKMSANRRNVDFRQQGFNVAEVQNLDDHTVSHVRDRTLQYTGKYANKFAERHALVAGWDLERNRRREDRTQVLRLHPSFPGTSGMDFDATIDHAALYLQDEWTPSERLSLYLGLRDERIATRTSGSDFAQVSRHEHMLSPLMQVLWKPSGAEDDQLRLGLNRTYKSPAIETLIPRPYTSTNNSPLDPDTRGNPALRPQKALGLDLAYEHNWKGGAMISLGGYLRKVDGLTRDTITREGERWVSYPVNGGGATIRGLEMDTKFKLADAIAGAPKVELRANLTRNWSEVDDVPGPNNRVEDQLRLSSTVGADYLASERWSVGASYTFKLGGEVRTGPERYDTVGTRRELDAYALFKLTPASKLRLSLSNVLRQDLASGTRYVDADGDMRIAQYRTSPVTLRATFEWSR